MASQNHGSKGIMTFYPTMEEFKNFSRYIAYIESKGAHKAGLAKIVPPKEWKPRSSYDNIDDLVIPAPIQQFVTGQSGLFTQYNIQKKALTVGEFRKLANSDKFCSPHYDDFEELERKYWKNVTFNPPIYGADVNGSLYDPDIKEWNICHLNTILDTVEHESGITIEGVNTPYLYFGMWKTTFAWHTEDMDLYSINYLHFGEPKSWYCIPPEHGKRFERLAQGFFPGSSQICEAFLRHKMTLISPSILKKYGIPFDKITQEAGEFMITFPYAYHAGFNHGLNCAESTNFATERWIEYGKQAVLCSCRKDMVKISMDVFVRKFQPERYESWLAGQDVVPINHSRPTPEAKEFLGESFGDAASNGSFTDGCAVDGERKGSTHRIETKRHRVCLEVPADVISKNDEEEKPYGKRPRLNLIPPRTLSQDVRRNKGPPKLVVTPTKLTLLDPFHRSFTQNHGEVVHPRHYAKTRAPAISSQSQHRNGHLSVSAAPMWTDTSTQPARKMGVASLLFHRTLSPKDALQVQSYTLEKKQQPHTQLQQENEARPEISKPAELQTQTQTTKLSKMELDASKNKRKKQQQAELCKLPRHHPLVREVHSDDDMYADMELEQEEKEEWAKPLAWLWQSRPFNPQAEREYNKSMGQQPPYCSICLLFHTHQTKSESGSGSQCVTLVNHPGGRQWSKPLIPEMCFNTQSSRMTEGGEGQLSNPHLAEDGTSRLVSCRQCLVRVHASCYGVAGDEGELDDWLCSRCEANAVTE
uniref:[histone H3]-trimethyl-L-lysine(9) demethylase n=1 Tax=Tetraodon nigroviridis TaxID=99883 RepID=H3D0F1_TETNG